MLGFLKRKLRIVRALHVGFFMCKMRCSIIFESCNKIVRDRRDIVRLICQRNRFVDHLEQAAVLRINFINMGQTVVCKFVFHHKYPPNTFMYARNFCLGDSSIAYFNCNSYLIIT